MRRLKTVLPILGLLTFLSLQTPLTAQEVPSPSDVLGYDLGEEFTPVAFFPEDLQKFSGVISEKSLGRLGQSTWMAQVGLLDWLSRPAFYDAGRF